MIEWFNSLDSMLKIYWACAIVSSLFFIIQLILLFIGVDSDATDADISSPDFDGGTTDVGGAFTIFSIKNLINFLVGFGWAGVCLYNSISNGVLLTIVALLIGAAFVAMFFIIYKQTRKLESNGAFNIKDCLGQTADVYLRVPAAGEGKGKVQISIGGSIHEIDALAQNEAIPTGSKVKIVEIIDGSTVRISVV